MIPAIAMLGFQGGNFAPPEIVVNAVDFDSLTYLKRGGDLTGAVDTKLSTGSVWLYADVSGQAFVWTTSTGFNIRFRADGKIQLADAGALDIRSSDIATGGWHHFMWSLDMSDIGKRHMYVDDVSDLNVILTYVDVALDHSNTNHTVGANKDNGDKLNGKVAQLIIMPGVYMDLSVEANRRKFISAGGKPVDVGSDGSRPFGAQPILFLDGDTANWHTNKGSGGGFTENGTLTTAPTSPSD